MEEQTSESGQRPKRSLLPHRRAGADRQQRSPGGRGAFQAGISVAYPQARIPFQPVQGVLVLEHVWPVIDGLEGKEKATVVAAAVTTVMADRVVTLEESELLRTVCGVLHCPVPPVV